MCLPVLVGGVHLPYHCPVVSGAVDELGDETAAAREERFQQPQTADLDGV